MRHFEDVALACLIGVALVIATALGVVLVLVTVEAVGLVDFGLVAEYGECMKP